MRNAGDRDYCVYRHTSPTGKVYIGVTRQKPEARWKNGNGYKYNAHFYSAILRYGWDNFKHEILSSGLTKEEAAEAEITFIRLNGSGDPSKGYNHATGGFNPTPGVLTRRKLSCSMKSQFADGLRTRVRTPEACARTSDTLKRRFASGELTRVISEEQRKKLSGAHKGKTLSESHKEKIQTNSRRKPVAQYRDGECVGVYPGVRAAGRETGIDYTSILKVLKGTKHTAGGYAWRYN